VGPVASHPNQPPLAGSEHLGGNGVDIDVGEIRQEARFRQHCGGDGSRVVVCWHPGSGPLCLSLREQFISTGPTFRWPGRPGGDALGPVALVAAFGHMPGDLVAALGERLTNASATSTTAHYRPRPRVRRAGCRAQQPGLRRSVQVADHRGPSNNLMQRCGARP
jgi:hypothetical protein